MAAVCTAKGPLGADAYVLALGCWSARFGRALGLDLPVYPIKGYSVTLPIEGRNNPPTLSGVDEDNLFAFANFGDRVRMTAIAEFAGWDTTHRPQDFAPMLRAARELFPSAGNYDKPEYWAGLRPMTPDNLPIFGPGRPRQPLGQYRPRPYGVDLGLRLGPDHRRSDRRADARARRRGHARPLRESPHGPLASITCLTIWTTVSRPARASA